MPSHWTYTAFKPNDGLHQGDIIAREPLLEVLEVVHHHFTDPKYLAFIVLTQTCDLVIRKSNCKANHISLAVIRPLSALMPGFLEELCDSPRPGLFSKTHRVRAEEFLHRVLNQNEQAQGWVYLHPDAEVGIGEPAVAMLRISISLRANEHYELLRRARCGRLETEYRNKLGWLKGNLYSRIDTPDWSEKESGDEEEKKIIKDLLETPVDDCPPLWVSGALIAEAKKRKVQFDGVPMIQLQEELRKYAPKPALDIAIEEIKRIINQLRLVFTDQPVEHFKEAIESDLTILPLIHHLIVTTVRTAVGSQHFEPMLRFSEMVAADDDLCQAVIVVLKQAATDFLQRKGKRDVALFFDSLAPLALLSTDEVDRVMQWVEATHCAETSTDADSIRAALQTMKCPPYLIAHLKGVAAASIQNSLADLVASRLTNSSQFKKTLRPDE